MSKLHSILSATDLSTPARHAAERAAQLSQECGVPLCLLHVANLAPLQRLRQMLASDLESVEHKVLSTARERLQAEADALHSLYGVNVDDRLVVGSLITEIRAVADELASDVDRTKLARACDLAKADLVTNMVYEFSDENNLDNIKRHLFKCCAFFIFLCLIYRS